MKLNIMNFGEVKGDKDSGNERAGAGPGDAICEQSANKPGDIDNTCDFMMMEGEGEEAGAVTLKSAQRSILSNENNREYS